MAATGKQWYVREDGCISIGESASTVTYHSALNSIIVSTAEPSVKIYDVASGALLQKSNLAAQPSDTIKCLYLPETDKVVFCDESALGARSDMRGMLLLDTALQSSVANPDDAVKVEIPLAEAGQLLKSLVSAELPGVDHVEDVVRELEKKIDVTQEATKGHLKTAKWATVCLELPLSRLKSVCSGLVVEMKRLSLYNPGLAVASAVSDRLSYLLPSPAAEAGNGPVERSMMYSEVTRQKTFRKWPHMNYKWALPDPMAQAGFYHQPNTVGDDRAMCFTCNVCLVCWEPTDEPWSEHERHSPACPFVKGEYTQNVPLCVTFGSQPAKRHGEKKDKIECLSTTAVEEFVATSTTNGNIVVWNVSKLVKKHCQFNLDPTDPAIAVKTGFQIERSGGKEILADSVEQQVPVEVENQSTIDARVAPLVNGSNDDTPSSSVPVTEPQSHDSVYELPQNKSDKTEGVKTRSRPCDDIQVKSLCLVRKPVSDRLTSEKDSTRGKPSKKGRSKPQPTLFCGASLRRTKLSVSNREEVQCNSRTEEVQLMNIVNESVSSDSHSRIISPETEEELEEISLQQDELLDSTTFIPHLLVVAVKEDHRKHSKHKEKESKPQMKPSTSIGNLNAVPMLGSITSNHEWGILDPVFDSDPDPDVQIVGVTPGPISLSGENPYLLGDKYLTESQTQPIQSSVSNLQSSESTVTPTSGSSKPVSTKPKAGTVLQCVELPVDLQHERLYVSGISPTLDGQHLVVVVSPIKKAVISDSYSTSKPVISDSIVNNHTEVENDCVESADKNSVSLGAESESQGSVSHKDDLVHKGGCILIYRYKFSSSGYAVLEETPILTKYLLSADSAVTSVLILQQDFSDYEEEEGQKTVSCSSSTEAQKGKSSQTVDIRGQIAVTLKSGKLWLLNLCDLNEVAEITPPKAGEKFVSSAYCTGMERLCVCSADGRLHFYQLCEEGPIQTDVESPIDSTDGVFNGDGLHEPEACTSSVDMADGREHLEKNSPGSDILAKKPLTVENLMILHNLIQFENLMPRFTATVPPCWTEIQQEQQQRRHPQHLQHQGEATQHTRTWKLQPDSNTWDEHLIEIVLPRPCCVGHVDVKFTLHPMCTSPPDVQVTLLKQNITSIGRQTGSSSSVDVDQGIDFKMNSSEPEMISGNVGMKQNGFSERVNNVLDPLFQDSHNAEILCGPVNISSCLDLSGNSGLITLTSPQLLSSKPKAFLLHVKGFPSKNDEKNNEKQKELKKKAATPAPSSAQKMKVMKTAFDNDLFIPPSKVKEAMTSSIPRPKYPENLKGCDWIQELSVTIRKTKKIQLPKERLQRNAMIDHVKFHERLLSAVSLEDGYVFNGVSADHYQNMGLDILMWISAVQMNDPAKRSFSKSLPASVKPRLEDIIKSCFIQGTRTTAHKCGRLLAFCMEQCKQSADPDIAPNFSYSLLHALMETLPLLPCANFAGSVRWFFNMLNRVKCMDVGKVSHLCTDLLMKTSKHYNDRNSSLHALLKSRFGLYGQPFDSDLFDTDLPLALRQTVPSLSYTSAQSSSSSSTGGNNNNNTSSTSVADELDYYDLFNPPSEKSSKIQLEYAKSSLFGLLEVEPLHFSCHSTSDGTKMERMDTNTGGHLPPSGLSGTINFGEGIPPQPGPATTTATFPPLSSTLAMPKQHLHELTTKSYPTFKHKMMHIKLYLSEMRKMLPVESASKHSSSSDHLLPPTPKTTPQVMTPPLTPPNEWQQNQGSSSGNSDTKGDNSKQFSAHSTLGSLANAQTLLQQPPLQVLVIERMHSGARRFVILDFGKPVVLTDVVIPACADLASLSIDVWVQGEEVDGQRFVVASDIGVRSLIMNDIMPALVCRYLKITTIGRYGSGSSRSKIPIGAFYGHSCILPWEWNSYLEQCCSHTVGSQTELPTQSHLLAQLGIYMSLLEDIQCRYSLAKTRLESLLTVLDSQQYASAHVQYYLKRNKKHLDEDNKIIQAYHDCLQLQLQLNLAQRATNRLHNALGFKVTHTDYGTSLSSRLRQACSDKLRFIQECLLEVLLSITTSSPSIPQPPMSLFNILSPHTSELLFKNLCVHGTKKIQISTGMLLMRVCGSQPWWGNFLGNVLQEFFHSENTQIFSQDRVFVLLLAMGQKALSGPCAVPIMESLLDMLARVLSPLISGQRATLYSQSGLIDLTLVGWILLFLCRNLDHTTLNSDDSSKAARKERDNGNMLPNRWNFIQGDHNSTTAAAVNAKSKASKLCRGSRLSMQKRLLHHKQKLMDLQQAQKTFFSSHMEKSSQNSTNALLKQQEKEFRKELSKYASKHIKDIIQMRRTEVEMLRKMTKSESGSDSDKSSSEDDQDIGLVLPKDKTLRVVKGLMALLLNMDFTCNVDLFLVTCKVLATICVTTRPAITLAEAMSQEQLERLILLASNVEFSHGNVSWGGPWAGHAVTSLLQDILDGEKFYPANASSCTEVSSEDVMGFGAETDDSLPKSISLPVLEETGDQEPSSLDKPEIDASDSKDDSTKMNFEKESSLMVDLLLDDGEFDDDTSAKLHAYVTGESVKPPPPPSDQILYENGLPSSSLNGTLEMANYVDLEQEKKKNIFKKLAEKISDAQGKDSWVPGNSTAFRNSLVAQGMSTAVDARLEFGLETQAELRLKVMMSLHTEAVQQAFSCPLPAAPSLSHSMEQMMPPSTDDELSEANSYLTQSEITSSAMLSQCYEALFSHLPPHCTNLDTLLHLWLTLNGEGNTDGNTTPVTFDPTRIPLIPLSQSSVSNLLSVLSSMPSIPICTWVLAFQTLTLLSNQKIPSQNGAPDVPMVVVMLADTNLITVIKKFLSGTSDHGPVASAVQFTQIGPSATKSFQEFLLRLLVKCSPDSLPKLKELMLKLVYTLSAERGAFHCGLGPLDAQCKFLDFILDNTYEQVDISNAISVIESISSLVHQHIQCQERISCRSSSENNINARSCFGGLFTSLLRGNDSRSSGDASRDTLMCSLLRLINKLIQTRCNTVRTTRMVSIGLDTSTTTEPHTPTNISMSEPVPDSTKLVQALATSTPTSTVRLSDEEKSQQTDEQKTENLNTQSDMMGTYIADIILGHQQIMCNLIQALSYCNSNTMAMMLGSRGMSSHIQDTFTGSEPISVGDGIYQILVTLTRHCSDQKLVLESLFHYLSGSYQMAPSHSISRLSEPLLWFVLKVLDSARVISVFLEMGGIQVLCRNLVNCNCRIISTNPSLISTIMHNLNGKSRSTDKKVNGLDSDSSDGLQNFAPLGSITSSSPTASPAEVLIQASPPHRRARSAAWSYHFYPDEAWVDLTIQLPFAILLKEVQIQPHSASLTTCPAYVSLEISHDCVTTTPLCQPLLTSSLAFIKLQLQRPDIATTVTIRLHKARDSMTIGLSQVLLMGYSTFGDTGHVSHNIFMPNEDFVSKSGVRWIRLLHHCLTAHKEVEEAVATAAAPTANLLNTCSALLVSPVSSIYVPNIEEVLLKLGLHSVDMGLVLMDSILRSSQPQTHSGVASPYLGKVSGHANDSTVELLHQLGTVQDQGTYQRVQALLQWVHDSAKMALQKSSVYVDDNYRQRDSPYLSLPSPAPSHIQCVSGVLWRSHELPVEYNLRSLITKELVSSMYEWSTILKVDSNLKKAVDYVLCAMCHIDPEYFSQILVWMGIMVSGYNSMSASISDDRKDNSQPYQGSMTDDSKEASNVHGQQSRAGNHVTEVPPVMLQDFTHLSLEESHLSTLSFTCKSPVAIKQLLYSGFPAVLAQGLFEFCNKVINRCSESYVQSEGLTDSYKTRCEEGVPSFTTTVTSPTPEDSEDKALWITADRVASVLHFLAEVSTEPLMKDWLGGPEGNIFWPAMLTMLCNTPVQTSALANNTRVQEIMSMENRACIETAAVHFFTQVMSCHSINQLLFAKVLCEVIKEQTSSTKAGQSLGNFPLSGFTRCLFLQALLEDEKILVVLRSANQQSRGSSTARISNPVQHPRHSGGRGTQTLVVSLHSTIADIKNKVTDLPSLPGQFLEKAAEKSDETKKDMENYTEMADYLSSSMVAGHAAKEKRDKEDKGSGKSSLPPRPPTRRGRHTADNMTSSLHIPVTMLSHALMPNSVLPGELTLSQLLQVLHQRGLQHGQGVLEFTIHQDTKKSDSKLSDQTQADSWEDTEEESESLLSMSPFPTALQVFASVGGLALLAEHLPLLYPEMSRQPSVQEIHAEKFCKTMSNSTEDWVTVEQYPEEFYEHYELLSPAPNSSKTTSPAVAMPTIPPHSLVAFGLFLRLPGYAEVLLKERKKAQCLLRLVLGVTDDGDGGHILTSPIACSLPTLPFLVLKSLYDTTPLTTDDGVLLRRMSLDIWAIHLILACLSVLSHHAPRVPVQGFQQEAQMILSAMQSANVTPSVPVNTQTEEKSQQYWAKGTGFGTGSTTSSWDAEQALLRQKSEEEHVACLLQVLASYINPGGEVPKDFDSETFTWSSEKSLLPEVIPELLSQSCLVPAISSYLRNDSVLDMARHIPLYRSLLELLRGLAVCPSLVPLLLPLDKENNPDSSASVGLLLDKMRGCVDTYASRLKSNKGKNGGSNGVDEEENEGLAMLIPNIQDTAKTVKLSTDRLQKSVAESERSSDKDGPQAKLNLKKTSAEERYMMMMKELQFDTFEFVIDDNGIKFACPHHYENNVKAAGDINNAARTRRLAQEAVTLSTSLPLSAGSSVFVRCDEERLDIMKVLITGPSDTPYDNGCFEFDVYFPQDYPNSPPFINLETTGNHTIRFNPNLYNDGKVCLSVLNTWHGRPEEKWNAQTSSFLQVLVSIQSLILVSEPYFNEPGYERSRGTPSGTASSREYDANIRQATVKWAMLEQLRNPSACLKEVVHKHFWLKRHEILRQCESWIAEMEGYCSDKRTGRAIAHSTLALKRHYNQLREELAKLKTPEGLEDSDSEETIDPKGVHFSTDSSLSSSLNNQDPVVAGPSTQVDTTLMTDVNSNSF